MNLKFSLFLVLTVLMFSSGCSAVKVAPYTGFLQDYSKMVVDKEHENLQIEDNAHGLKAQYSKVLIAPVVLNCHADSKGLKINEEKLNELKDFFYEELNTVFTESFTLADVPAKDTFIVRAAITEVVPNKPYLNMHWATTITGAGIGGAAMEAEIVDSLTGKRLFAIVDTRKGGLKESDNIVKGYFKGWTRWGNTKLVFKKWAVLLSQQITE